MNLDINSHPQHDVTNLYSALQNDVNFFDLEHHSICIIEKQHFLESQLQESRAQVKALNSSKMELEMTLNRERRELADIKVQLKVIQGTMQYWEQERSNQRDTSVTQKLQLESLQEERNLYNEQLKNLEIQNIELKLNIENFEKQVRNQSEADNVLNSKKKTVDMLLEQVYCESQKLDRELALLKKKVVLAKHTGEQMIVMLKQHHDALSKIYEENEALKLSKIILEKKWSVKSEQTSADTDISNTRNELKRLHQQMQNYEEKIYDLNQKLMVETEAKQKLDQTLKNLINEQINFDGMEDYFGSSR